MNKYSPSSSGPKTRVAIAGATGYAGIELVHLLARHPFVELVALFSSGRSGKSAPIGELVPALEGVSSLLCEPGSPQAVRKSGAQILLLATPHETSMEWTRELLAPGQPPLRIIDLSGAFRFQNAAVFEKWYNLPHTAPELLNEAVYGWPEKNRAIIPQARLVANPGCYATTATVALWPLLKSGLAKPEYIICDAKSGASGAGKGLRDDLHFVELEGNCKAYGVLTHRHTPEIAEQSGVPVEQFTFTPHLLPVSRGILATSYVALRNGAGEAEIESAYRDAYQGSPFVRFKGTRLPEINQVVHTNFCDVGFRLNAPAHQVVVVSCLDNLLKGAAGQAVQNLNCMIGCAEETALL